MGATPDGGNTSRSKKLETDGFELEFPHIDSPYLIEYLFDIGPTAGEHQITHCEIAAWQRGCGVELQPWEIKTIRKLSLDYLNETHLSRRANHPAPYVAEDIAQANRDAVDSQVRGYFAARGSK